MASQKPVKSHALAMRSSRLPKDLDKGKARIKPQANPNVGRHSEAGAAQFDYEMLAVPTGIQAQEYWGDSSAAGPVQPDTTTETRHNEYPPENLDNGASASHPENAGADVDEDGYAGEYETMDEREDYEDKGAGEIELNEDSSNETVRGSVKVRRQNKGLPRGVRGDDKNVPTPEDVVDAIENLHISDKVERGLLQRQYRSAETVAIQNAIRKHIGDLMQRTSKSDKFPSMPTAHELRRFTRHGLGGPTLSNFRVLITGLNSSCPWNQVAAEIAAKNYISNPDALTQDFDFVKKTILTHFRSLGAQQTNLRHQELESEDEEYIQGQDRKKANKKRTRRRDLGLRRKNITESFRSLNHFTKVMIALRTEGISGDERDSDLVRVPPRYLIHKLEWRSAELTHFLRTLDLLHISTRFTEKGQPTPGNWPRYRVQSSIVDNISPVVKGLPLNFYDSEWLLDLDPEHRAQLEHKPPLELKMPDNLLALAARYRHVKSKDDAPLPPAKRNKGSV